MNFELNELRTGDRWELKKEANGRPVMLTFWTSWCQDSYKDLAAKRPLYQTMDENQLCFVTINVTGREGEVDLQEWLKQHNHQFLVLKDEGTTVYDQFGCEGVPTTVLLNKELRVTNTFGENTSMASIMASLTTIV
ncbi:LOW QUALITY PROTEIN: thioredoxin [Bacillus sp. JCM 19047]|nr:LOW QUALITY PROTEIN: thioredoxin [Bacillus sp. JCM 19047]